MLLTIFLSAILAVWNILFLYIVLDIGTIIFTDENEIIKTVMPNNLFMNNNIEAADANEIADGNIFLSGMQYC